MTLTTSVKDGGRQRGSALTGHKREGWKMASSVKSGARMVGVR